MEWDDIHETLIGAARSVGAEITSPWFYTQLGIILANAELLEVQITDPAQRTRASQVVSSALDAMATTRDLRALISLMSADPGTPSS